MADATYTPSPISRYAGNPLIEALPPVLSDIEVIERLEHYPQVLEQERRLPAKERMPCALALYDVFQPTPFHLKLERVLSAILREGYHGRNPFDPATLAHSHYLATQGRDGVPPPHPRKLTARSIFATGLSRMGKTRGIERILSLYPQVIQHTRYGNQPLPLTQVTWLKVSTPKNGSLRELGLAFFTALDDLFGGDQFASQAMRKAPQGDTSLLPLVCKRVRELNLGVLVVDELQRLSLVRSQGKTAIQKFLHSLIDEVGIPVVFIGTYQAYEIFSGSLQETARIAGSGSYELKRPDRGSEEWGFLVETLWKFQWLEHPTPLEPAIIDLLYDLTQGVTEILVTLLVLSQWRAMLSGKECLDEEVLRETSEKELGLLKAPLEALASGDPDQIGNYEDLVPNIDLRGDLARNAYEGTLKLAIDRAVREAIDERSSSGSPSPKARQQAGDENGKASVSEKVAPQDPADLRNLADQPDVLRELAKRGMLLTFPTASDLALKPGDGVPESNED